MTNKKNKKIYKNENKNKNKNMYNYAQSCAGHLSNEKLEITVVIYSDWTYKFIGPVHILQILLLEIAYGSHYFS